MKRFIKKILNIGENLKWQRRGISQKCEGRNDYQGTSLRDDGIVWSATNSKLQLTQRVMIVFAAIRMIVALQSNLYRITCQIRGNLNLLKRGMAIAELNRRMNPGNCGETRWQASLSWDGGIVQSE
jgi:hypothetical protein